MSHNPDSSSILMHLRSDLILSGHTHAGGIRLPFIGSIFPYIKFIFGYLIPPHI